MRRLDVDFAFEIFTDEIPFPKLPKHALFQVAAQGRQPERPKPEDVLSRGLDDDIWNLLCSCWSKDPNTRPNMADICLSLEKAMGSNEQEEEISLTVLDSDGDVLTKSDVFGVLEVDSDGSSDAFDITEESDTQTGNLQVTSPSVRVVVPQSAPASPAVGRTFMLHSDQTSFSSSKPPIPLSSAHSAPSVPTRADFTKLPPPVHPKRLAPGWKAVPDEDGNMHYLNAKKHMDTRIRPDIQHLETSGGYNPSRSSLQLPSFQNDIRGPRKARSFEGLSDRFGEDVSCRSSNHYAEKLMVE